MKIPKISRDEDFEDVENYKNFRDSRKIKNSVYSENLEILANSKGFGYSGILEILMFLKILNISKTEDSKNMRTLGLQRFGRICIKTPKMSKIPEILEILKRTF